MNLAIKEIDQSSWVCYSLPNNSYYYGEAGYLDESGIVHPRDSIEAANNPANKLVKHGFGIYLTRVNPDTFQPESVYEGYWNKDLKHGQGKLKLKKGVVYEGSFKQGQYHGQGKMLWPNKNSYEGSWKNNKMDGAGTFRHHQNFSLKGIFKANFYVDEDILRNPQLNEKEYQRFKKERKEILKQKQKQQKIKHGFVSKVHANDGDEIKDMLVKSVKNNRVPFVFSSKVANFSLTELRDLLKKQFEQTVVQFDLRKAYILQGGQKHTYCQQFHQNYRKALVQGNILLINLDESSVQFEQMYYPDIKEFYESNGFHGLSWSRDQLNRPQVRKNVIEGYINQDFKLLVWSKYKLSQNITQQMLRQKMQMRFEKILPFIKFDLVFIISPAHEENSPQKQGQQ